MKDLVAERIPWVVYEAADWLRETIKPGWRIFEWGSGGSTTFFLSSRCWTTTVEHDDAWASRVAGHVLPRDMRRQWTLKLVHPVQSAKPIAKSLRAPGCFAAYANVVTGYNDLNLVFVDGRARNHCAKLAAPRINPGGWLVLDNSDRADYKPTFDLLKDWAMVEFYGHGPLSDILWKTTMWRKPGGTP